VVGLNHHFGDRKIYFWWAGVVRNACRACQETTRAFPPLRSEVCGRRSVALSSVLRRKFEILKICLRDTTVCVWKAGSLVSGDYRQYSHRGRPESSLRRPKNIFLVGGSGQERLQGMPGDHTRVPAASFGGLRSPKRRFVIRVEAQIRNFEDMPT
jgi:hypothetical protein